jgi:hypothetical protein
LDRLFAAFGLDADAPGGWPAMPNLDLYYRNCVIGGPGVQRGYAARLRAFMGGRSLAIWG